jgi:hypothetical protein
VVAAADECMTVRVAETVTNASGPATAGSDPTGGVTPCMPSNTAVATVTGTQAVGETLTANPGTWSNAPGATPTYQWQRCDADGANCADVTGETGTSYVLGAADDCMTVRVAETVTNASGAGTAGSDPTGKVGPCTPPTPDPDPDPTPDPQPTPDPGTGTTTTSGTTAGTVTDPANSSVAANTGARGCLRLVAGRKRMKLRPYGVLRLAATKNTCVAAPIKVTLKPRKGTALKSVSYKLDGKRLKRVKRLKFGAKLRPEKLTAGTHTVRVRVTPRVGKAKTYKLRLRFVVA